MVLFDKFISGERMKTLFAFFLIFFTFESAYSVGSLALSDTKSVVRRSDGKFDVVCSNGDKEVASAQEIIDGKICQGMVVVPKSDMEAVFAKSGDDFYVLCLDKTWRLSSSSDVTSGKVCNVDPGIYKGKWKVRLFASIRSKGESELTLDLDKDHKALFSFSSIDMKGTWKSIPDGSVHFEYGIGGGCKISFVGSFMKDGFLKGFYSGDCEYNPAGTWTATPVK